MRIPLQFTFIKNKLFNKTVSLNIVLIWLAVFLFLLPVVSHGQSDNVDQFADALNLLKTTGFKDKEAALHSLEDSSDPRTIKVMRALLSGRLNYSKDDGRIVYAEKGDEGYRITDVLDGSELGIVGKREIKKIKVNNNIRTMLRVAIARLSLSSEDPEVRLSAVNEMSKDPDSDTADLLREALIIEDDTDVRDSMLMVVALVDIDSNNKEIQLKAIDILSDSLDLEARNKIATLLQKDANGQFLEKDKETRDLAIAALKKLDSKHSFFSFIENVFFGISLGSVLLLIAIGLAITFGVMGVINMAHGELMMLGAYTTYVVQLLMPDHIGLSLFVAIPAAFIVSGLFGIAIERGVIRYLYGRPLETLLATFGISLILQQLVRSIFSPLNRSVETPAWMSGSLEINSALSLTYNRLYIVVFSLLVFAGLLLILKKTSLGLQVRAVSQNRSMAKAMGIRTDWVDALTFGLGSGVAGVAGVALSQLTNVGPNLGQTYIIDSFMVVVFGGVGNLWGTLVGAMSLGVGNKFLEPWAGAVLAKILILVFIILFIQKRPRGLFPQKGRATEN